MFGFKNKRKELESEVAILKADLKAEEEQTDTYVKAYEAKKKELVDLKGALDISNGRVLKATTEIELCYAMMSQLREQVAQGEAYKADNLTLISRVAQAQELLGEERARHSQTQIKFDELNDVAKQLIAAVDEAKSKRARAAEEVKVKKAKKTVRKKKRK